MTARRPPADAHRPRRGGQDPPGAARWRADGRPGVPGRGAVRAAGGARRPRPRPGGGGPGARRAGRRRPAARSEALLDGLRGRAPPARAGQLRAPAPAAPLVPRAPGRLPRPDGPGDQPRAAARAGRAASSRCPPLALPDPRARGADAGAGAGAASEAVAAVRRAGAGRRGPTSRSPRDERGGGGRDLPPPGRAAPGDRAGRGAGAAAAPPALLRPRLDDRLPLLTGGRRDAPARQQTLRATHRLEPRPAGPRRAAPSSAAWRSSPGAARSRRPRRSARRRTGGGHGSGGPSGRLRRARGRTRRSWAGSSTRPGGARRGQPTTAPHGIACWRRSASTPGAARGEPGSRPPPGGHTAYSPGAWRERAKPGEFRRAAAGRPGCTACCQEHDNLRAERRWPGSLGQAAARRPGCASPGRWGPSGACAGLRARRRRRPEALLAAGPAAPSPVRARALLVAGAG